MGCITLPFLGFAFGMLSGRGRNIPNWLWLLILDGMKYVVFLSRQVCKHKVTFVESVKSVQSLEWLALFGAQRDYII